MPSRVFSTKNNYFYKFRQNLSLTYKIIQFKVHLRLLSYARATPGGSASYRWKKSKKSREVVSLNTIVRHAYINRTKLFWKHYDNSYNTEENLLTLCAFISPYILPCSHKSDQWREIKYYDFYDSLKAFSLTKFHF